MEQISKKGLISWLIDYIKDAKAELGKVSWPSKKTTIKYSLFVVGVSIILAAFFTGFDWALTVGLEALVKLVS
jgi:preprotein translocase SecE subunit